MAGIIFGAGWNGEGCAVGILGQECLIIGKKGIGLALNPVYSNASRIKGFVKDQIPNPFKPNVWGGRHCLTYMTYTVKYYESIQRLRS